MEIKYTVYNKYTGSITRIGCCELALVGSCIKCYDVESILEGMYNMFDHYIDIVTRKPQLKREMSLKIDGTTISEVPNGSIMKVEELSHDMVDVSHNVELDMDPGIYHVHIYHPQYFDKSVLIEVK